MKFKKNWPVALQKFSAGYLEKISIAGLGVGLFKGVTLGLWIGFIGLVTAMFLSCIEEE